MSGWERRAARARARSIPPVSSDLPLPFLLHAAGRGGRPGYASASPIHGFIEYRVWPWSQVVPTTSAPHEDDVSMHRHRQLAVFSCFSSAGPVLFGLKLFPSNINVASTAGAGGLRVMTWSLCLLLALGF